jgi:hypothetical protein
MVAAVAWSIVEHRPAAATVVAVAVAPVVPTGGLALWLDEALDPTLVGVGLAALGLVGDGPPVEHAVSARQVATAPMSSNVRTDMASS